MNPYAHLFDDPEEYQWTTKGPVRNEDAEREEQGMDMGIPSGFEDTYESNPSTYEREPIAGRKHNRAYDPRRKV